MSEGVYESIPLFTRAGERVTTVVIPRFNPRAEVLVWGTRTFVLDPHTERYSEGMVHFVLPDDIKKSSAP